MVKPRWRYLSAISFVAAGFLLAGASLEATPNHPPLFPGFRISGLLLPDSSSRPSISESLITMVMASPR
jgi:hypothetical protein